MNPSSREKYLFTIIFSLAILSIVFLSYIFLYTDKDEDEINNAKNSNHTKRCLKDNEKVEYEIDKKEIGNGDIKIFVKDKDDDKVINSFIIKNASLPSRPVETYRCNTYVGRQFNWDYSKYEALPGFERSVWKYSYAGTGERIIKTAGENASGEPEVYYSSDFRVDPTETYIVLEKGYSGSPEPYSVVFKDINTLEDVFTLSLEEIMERNSNLVGAIGFYEGWTKDGRYFWIDIFQAANVMGYVRIDTEDWSYQTFDAPPDVLGGDAFNVEKGFVTVHPGNVWYGFEDMTEQEKEKRRQEGMGTELYIYNLFTKEKIKVAETDEPLYFFRPSWRSETELQYEMPEGEVKVYELKK